MVSVLPIVDNKSILTETSGFLSDGFTHTINAYSGCSFAGSLCGGYCYAQHNHWITRGRDWKLLVLSETSQTHTAGTTTESKRQGEERLAQFEST